MATDTPKHDTDGDTERAYWDPEQWSPERTISRVENALFSAHWASGPAFDDEELHHAYAIKDAYDRLRTKLPKTLRYHAAAHTISDVVPAIMRLTAHAPIHDDASPFPRRDARRLLRVAAAYHDLGFAVQPTDNEPIAARLAGETLPTYGFRPEEVLYVQELVLATRMPQRPAGIGQMLLCDADLDNLGREDFFLLNEQLRLELNAQGQSWEPRPWLERSLGFLKSHAYHTDAARRLRDEGKRRNIEQLERLLAAPGTPHA